MLYLASAGNGMQVSTSSLLQASLRMCYVSKVWSVAFDAWLILLRTVLKGLQDCTISLQEIIPWYVVYNGAAVAQAL